MKRLISLFAIILAGNALASDPKCSDPIPLPLGGVTASIEWTQAPDTQDEAKMLLRFWNSKTGTPQGPYVDPQGDVFVDLWMDMGGHGHGSAPTKIARKEAGVFEVKRVYFPMIGDWQVRIHRKLGTQVLERVPCIQAVSQ